jgi:NADH-quinone oxidoreductase subunit K
VNFVIVTMVLFSLALYGVLTRRDIVGVLASVEMMLGSAALLFVGLSRTTTVSTTIAPDPTHTGAIALVLMVTAAAGAAVGLALLVALSRQTGRTRTDETTEVKG